MSNFTSVIFKKMTRRISRPFKKLQRIIRNKRLLSYATHVNLNAKDLMIPIDGTITGIQVITITRIIDIENLANTSHLYWQNRLDEAIGDRKAVANQSRLDLKYRKLYKSLIDNKYDNSLSNIVASSSRVSFINGTHRIAYLTLYEPDKELNVDVIDEDIPYVCRDTDGIMYWSNYLNTYEINYILQRYDELVKRLDYYVIMLLFSEINADIALMDNCADIVDYKIISSLKLDEKIYSLLFAIGYVIDSELIGSHAQIVKVYIRSSDFYLKEGKIRSRVVDRIEKHIREEYTCYFLHTSVDSIKFENCI